MTNHAYRQGFEEGWSTGAANPGSPATAQFRKGRGRDWHFDGYRVADFQNQGVQGRIQKRAMGGFLEVLGSASASFGRRVLLGHRGSRYGGDEAIGCAAQAQRLAEAPVPPRPETQQTKAAEIEACSLHEVDLRAFLA